MKPVRATSLGLWLATVAISVTGLAATIWIEPLAGMTPVSRFGVGASILAVLLGAFLIPRGLSRDRAVRRLSAYIETLSEAGASRSFARPRWLSPITRAVTGIVDRFMQREQGLKNQLRDLEIRHRVSEAERRQIEAVLHALRDGVLVTDAFDEIVIANAGAARILGFELDDSMHQALDRVVASDRLCRLVADTRASANFDDRRDIEDELLVQQGDETASRTYEISLQCVANHKQEVGGVVTILHDLTHEREVSQMKSDFVSKASHELRTPLSSIRAYVEMLVDGDASDEETRTEFYGIIQSEAERLGRLIDNMLNISRIEAGIVQIERESVNLEAIIRRAVDTLEPQAREKNIALHKKLAPVDLSVEGDADMLYQVVLNLGSNALKYTPEGGRVTISADSDNLTRSVVVTVSDTGLGVPPDAVPKLFDKFFRVENYKRVAKGTGLGLNLCKHIVETVHHGQIGVKSKLGMGSRFWFSVPMRYAGSSAAA